MPKEEPNILSSTRCRRVLNPAEARANADYSKAGANGSTPATLPRAKSPPKSVIGVNPRKHEEDWSALTHTASDDFRKNKSYHAASICFYEDKLMESIMEKYRAVHNTLHAGWLHAFKNQIQKSDERRCLHRW